MADQPTRIPDNDEIIEATTIRLTRGWHLGTEIGSGTFGRVCEAEGEDGTDAAIKLIRKIPGADREMLFGSVTGANIIPMLDSGEWESFYVIVLAPVR
jgi:serine/threonine-protein kinase